MKEESRGMPMRFKVERSTTNTVEPMTNAMENEVYFLQGSFSVFRFFQQEPHCNSHG
jgi:hypothetical protein